MTSPQPGRGPGRPPHAHPGEGQDSLDGMEDPTPYSTGPGSMARAVAEAVAAGRAAGVIGPLDGAMAALAVEVGAAVDLARARRDPYGLAGASRELRTLLGRLGLDPGARGEDTGKRDDRAEWAELVAGLDHDPRGGPAVGDPAHP